jgi:AsmA protein
MSRTIKILLATVLVIVLLLIGLLVALPPMVNKFKPEIEKAVLEQTGLTLRLQGDIGVSLYPFIGVTIADVKVNEPSGELFAAVQEVRAAVALLPLLGGGLQVDKVIMDGAQLNLRKDAEGMGNWEIVAFTQAHKKAQGPAAEGDTADAESTDPAATTPAPTDNADPDAAPAGKPPMALPDIDIALISITRTNVSYQDAATGQAVELKDFNLELEDIRFDEFFPLALSFAVASQNPPLQLQTTLDVNLKASKDLQQLAIQQLKTNLQVVGEPTQNKTIQLELAADAALDLVQQIYTVESLDLTLDKTRLQGSAAYDGNTQKAVLNLKGTEFNLEDYVSDVAAVKTADSATPSASAKQTATSAKQASIPAKQLAEGGTSGVTAPPPQHPFELLKTLNLAATLQFAKILLPGHQLENLDLALTGSDGLLTLSKANLVLDGESLQLKLIVDARQQPVDTLKIAVGFNGQLPDLNLSSELSSFLVADAQFSQIELRNFRTDATLKGAAFGDKAAQVSVQTQLKANLAGESLQLKETAIGLNNLLLNSNLELQGFKTPRLTGSISVPDFSLKQLMESLGLTPPVTSKPGALTRVGLSAKLTGPANVIQLDDIRLQLDQTRFDGKARYQMDTQAVSASLSGDRIVVDDYLPPPSKEEQAAAMPIPVPQPAGTPESAATAEAELLPLETLRKLQAELGFKLQSLTFKEYQTENMDILITAKDGLIEVKKANASLYDGTVTTSATVDARTDQPVYQFDNKILGVNADKFPKSLARQEFLFGLLKIQPQGKINITSDYQSSGNTLSGVIDNAKATMDLYLEKGAIEELKTLTTLYQLASKFSADVADTSKLVASTPFKDLQTDFSLDGSKLQHNKYALQLNQDADVEGSGSIDLLKRTLKYDFQLKPTEAFVAKGNKWASTLTNIPLNYTCTADLNLSPVPSCGVDNSSIESALKLQAEEKLKAKASEKIDRLFDKKSPEEAAKPEEQKTEKEKQRDQLKDAGKNLLKGFLQ